MFGITKRNQKGVKLPAVLTEPENPVNYNSVLDYLVGLSQREYDKINKVSVIYRKANQEAAKVLGVKDQPTTKLKEEKPSDEQIDDALDVALHSDYIEDITTETSEPKAPKKAQAPSPDTKIDINEQ